MSQQIELLVAELEELQHLMNDDERRSLREWKVRLEDQDPFDRQDIRDMQTLLQERG